MAPGDRGESRRAEPEAGVPFRARRIEAPHQEADTYRCRVRRVIDGDTLEVTVEVGFGVEVYQVLRLREIDAPELSERDGKRIVSRGRWLNQELMCQGLAGRYGR